MFGARDVWFVVGLPVFLYAHGWKFLQVGGFLAAWTVAYGAVQAIAPSLVTRSADGLSREVPSARLWAAVLAAVPIALAVIMNSTDVPRPDLVLVVGLGAFRSAVRGEFVPAFLSDSGLCRIRKGRRGRRLLLCRQCGRPSARHHAFWRALSGRRHHRLPDRFSRHAAALLSHHIPNPAQYGRLDDPTGTDIILWNGPQQV